MKSMQKARSFEANHCTEERHSHLENGTFPVKYWSSVERKIIVIPELFGKINAL